MPLDDVSAAWVTALGSDGSEREVAEEQLHGLLVRAARAETRRRCGPQGPSGVELDDLAYHAAADAMLIVLEKLPTFRGESRFTTWAYKFVMFEVSAKLGRHFWRKHPTVPLEAEEWERLPAVFETSVEGAAEQQELLDAVRHAVEHELTEHQRRVFAEVVLAGIPLDALAQRLDTTRGALYKTLFDARRRLRASLVAKGYLERGR